MRKIFFMLVALCFVSLFTYPQDTLTRNKQQVQSPSKKNKTIVKSRREAELQLEREQEEARRAEEQRRLEEEARVRQEEERSIRMEEARRNLVGEINGHDYVDLGLPSGLKWATCNVGADKPSEYGNYYAWGESHTKKKYDLKESRTSGKNVSSLISAGIMNDSGKVAAQSDAASVNWGASWRLPTSKEYQELLDNCEWAWTSMDGRNGYKVTGSNGLSIFLPAAGWLNVSSRYSPAINGLYWCADPYPGNSFSYFLNLAATGINVGWNSRSLGLSVRPVSQ